MKQYQQKNVSDINLEDYLGEYESKQATVEDMFYDRFRKKESLNGLWHYAVDQYDTCIPYVKGITPWILYDFRCPRHPRPSRSAA